MMVDFGALSYDEQVTRLTDFAKRVLEHYGFQGTEYTLKCVSHWQNSTFRVDVDSGDRTGSYALRINRPESQTAETIRSELSWLNAINSETPLSVPQPIAHPQTTDYLLSVASEAIGGLRHCVLFRWIDGDFLDGELTPHHMAFVGQFMGQLHNHSAQFKPSEGFIRKRLEWDGQMREFYDEKGLIDSPIVPIETWALFDEVRAHVQPRMERLGMSADVYGLIHNDIYQNNMLFAGDEVRVIDFDNCGWAHYLLDIAVTLAQVRKHPDYPAKRHALLDGYQQYRQLSTEELDLLDDFIAARILLLALYMASQVDNPRMKATAPAYVAVVADDLRRWLKTGELYG